MKLFIKLFSLFCYYEYYLNNSVKMCLVLLCFGGNIMVVNLSNIPITPTLYYLYSKPIYLAKTLSFLPNFSFCV